MNLDFVVIQRNPRSGRGKHRERLLELVRALRSRGLTPRLFKDRERLREWVDDPAHRERLRCIVGAGGDGTVSDLFNRFPGIPIAILPLGTENLLARYLGIPRSGQAVARLIAEGSRRRFDLGLMGQRRFALMASAGFDADVIHRLHAVRTGPISHATYLQPILESLRKYEHPPLRVTVDDAPAARDARLAIVVNIPAYAFGLPVARQARGDDGQLDLRLFEQGSAFQMLRYSGNLALSRHERLPDVVSLSGRKVRLESERPVPLQADGDPAGTTPVEISVLPGALDVYAPPDEGKRSKVPE